MKAIMVMYDSLNRNMLETYGCDWTHTPNFKRLAARAVQFDNCYVGSMPCMPARRELHTGRYNFLHRSWGPLEPFDDSMPEILNNGGIHTHLATDHYHYFEDGGATYHGRYTTWEGVRGQEGDAWNPVVGYETLETRNICGAPADHWVEQDIVNRKKMQREEDMPQAKTFKSGLDFIDTNHDKDNWFVQIETFDPHEPFFVPEKYKKAYEDNYNGPLYDWPDYRPLKDGLDSDEDVQHMRAQYGALLSMCDDYLGKVLDKMDAYDLWEDTMLIVNTDHGFLLGEHGQWAKCHCPFYDEVAHTPLYIWDPRSKRAGVKVQSLVQTIDLPATLLEYFGFALPEDMQGKSLRGVIEKDEPIREAALFGIFGGQINCTDGRYVYMRSPQREDNQPLHQYTLMPTRHGGRRAFIDNAELRTATLHEPLSFTKGLPVLRTTVEGQPKQHGYKTVLYDLQQDPQQERPLQSSKEEQRMVELMKKAMRENDCPQEQFVRMGL